MLNSKMLTQREIETIRRNTSTEGALLPRVFSVLGDPGRWRIFRLFMDHHDLCVTEVARVIGVSVPAVSQQLRVMELSGLVAAEREGQKVCYRLCQDSSLVQSLMRLAKTF